MFSRFMNQAKLNKTISKLNKIAESEPNTGYSAIIAACLEAEAHGIFAKYPQYMRDTINKHYQFALNKFKQTDSFQHSLKESNLADCDEFNLVMSAVCHHAYLAKDLPEDELRELCTDTNAENLIKILVNLKLLPKRFLDDEFDPAIVA